MSVLTMLLTVYVLYFVTNARTRITEKRVRGEQIRWKTLTKKKKGKKRKKEGKTKKKKRKKEPMSFRRVEFRASINDWRTEWYAKANRQKYKSKNTKKKKIKIK